MHKNPLQVDLAGDSEMLISGGAKTVWRGDDGCALPAASACTPGTRGSGTHGDGGGRR